MKLNRKTKLGAIYAVLAIASMQVSALTLGRMRGGALLGKTLDVSVPVQSAADEDISSLCFAADVSFGDTPLESSRVTVQSQPGPQANTQLVRVTTSAAIDEAVVTVNLRSTCAPKASRRYVLLADPVSESGVGTLATAVAVASRAPLGAESGKDAVALPSGAMKSTPVAGPMPAAKPRMEAKKPVVVSVAKAVVSAAPVKVERDAAARAESQANTASIEELRKRVDDIAKWQASTSASEELLKSQTRTKALEADIKSLKLVAARNQTNLQTLAAAIERTETQNDGQALVYGLSALLAVCLGALGFVYVRVRRRGPDAAPWWSGGAQRLGDQAPVKEGVVTVAAVAADAVHDVQGQEAAIPAPVPDVPVIELPPAPAPLVDLDLALNDVLVMDIAPTATAVPAVVVAVSQEASRPNGEQSRQGNPKAINTKEMLDVRQQAEFFMALGQHDDAVKLLESNIRDSADANPMVFLDLLKIFHTLSRRADFERYREEFNQQFTGRIPPYANFLMGGNGLEVYEDICHQIIVLWPTEYTIDFIEQCLVRLPEDDPEQGLDLEAFKDLLLLYGVLKRLDQTQDSAVLPFSTSRTAHSQSDGASAAAAAAPAVMERMEPLPEIAGTVAEAPPSVMDLDLDLDLDLDMGSAVPSPSEIDNLIDFDMSGYDIPQSAKPPKP